ncbi:MAG: M20/M25/M40 family metallo-hydrolase [Terricaulis sp.]
MGGQRSRAAAAPVARAPGRCARADATPSSNGRPDPFGGVLRDGVVWGRGAIDDKSSIVGLMEAAEMLARAGRRPTRTIIFAFGHDEELGGEKGASVIAALLAERGVRAWFALDEGLAAVSEHPLTGGPAALIGVTEKGSGSLRVTATGIPGHSSMPPRAKRPCPLWRWLSPRSTPCRSAEAYRAAPPMT